MPNITYEIKRPISAGQLADVFKRSGIARPIEDLPRMAKMLEHANILVTAWDRDLLVGVARALSDFSFCCYLSDLAVDSAYQKSGIGKELIDLVHKVSGDSTMLLLLAAPSAMPYYPKVGFEAVANGWIIKRKA
ncbi:GNAT family N-acetyltransferase [Undibacterium sp.]|uniref:GNAT family N-acetyltransferase n=1 Tax=Undibacterium sp. TaxID=1914977 RepID=UPI002BF810D0|nr:GNAT family N-acetyltransferase [Undibacterium sp.]HTD04802.1 GNAT family N-acetyltransferase [Undibacterium sp.]